MFLQWNARTGLLERESQEDLEVNHSSGSLLQTQAVSMSRSYMATLGTAGLEKWRLAASPELVITHENPEGVWKCEFRSLHANSLIYVSAATGRLINFVLCTVRQNAGGKPWRFLAS
jgi:hypothetical protein